MFGWSCAEAQDPEPSPENLEEPILEVRKKLMQNNRLCNRDLNVVHLGTS